MASCSVRLGQWKRMYVESGRTVIFSAVLRMLMAYFLPCLLPNLKKKKKSALLSPFYHGQLVRKAWMKWFLSMLYFRKAKHHYAFFKLTLLFFALNPVGCGCKPNWKQPTWKRHCAWLIFRQSGEPYTFSGPLVTMKKWQGVKFIISKLHRDDSKSSEIIYL